MTDLETALLQAIHDNPADDTARLVLADWLEENGQPERAELLRLTLVLIRAPRAADRPAEERLRALLAEGVRPCVPEVVNSIGMRRTLIPRAPSSWAPPTMRWAGRRVRGRSTRWN